MFAYILASFSNNVFARFKVSPPSTSESARSSKQVGLEPEYLIMQCISLFVFNIA